MKSSIRRSIAAALLIAGVVATGAAQGQPPKPATPLKVQVVIARYEGDRKVSSLPYIIAVTANARQSVMLRMGSQIPIPVAASGNGPTVEYKNVGTNIDCSVTTTDDGRYEVYVSIEDTSVMERRPSDPAPTLRTFLTRNSVVLKDGQSSQYTAASDKTTGEMVKVDVTLNVEK
jgi:hypothetical protein